MVFTVTQGFQPPDGARPVRWDATREPHQPRAFLHERGEPAGEIHANTVGNA